MILLLILALLAAGAAFWLFSTLKKELGDHWQDYANAFTLQTTANKSLPPLEQIEEREVDVQYIGKAGRVESRPIRLYIPQSAGQPMPLVYVPHYEMAADSLELRRYLEKGW
ncbi:MAG: hypothetical protein ACI4ME_05920, partial [Aristaeellaceae bacterium]